MAAPDGLKGAPGLRAQAIAGARWTLASMLARTGLQVAQVALLARLLEPGDFGVMAIAMSALSIVQIFGDLGVSNALFSRGAVTPAQLSSLYWLNIAASVALAAALLAAAPWLAALYGAPALEGVLALGAAVLVAGASWQQLRVRAEKELQFRPVALLEIAASAAGLGAAVSLALAGAGPRALMGGLLAATLAGAALAWLLLADGWRPMLRMRLSEVREFLPFGAHVVGGELANALGSQLDILLGARTLGGTATGLYSLPRNLCLQLVGLVNPVVTRVGLPVLAKARDNPALLRGIYLQAVRMTASVNLPLFAALALFAPEAVALLFGPQWDGAATPLRAFAAWAAMRAAINPVGSLAIACGRAGLLLAWNLSAIPVLAIASVLGARHGPGGLAAALALWMVVALLAHWAVLVRPLCGAAASAYFAQLAVPAALAAIAAGAGALAALPFTDPAARVAAGGIAGAAAYLALSRAFNRAWLDTIVELVRPR